MQTQLDQSLIDLLTFHTLDVASFTMISTVTLFTNNIPDVVACGIFFIFKVFLLMDGFHLMFYAVIKYLLIFHQSKLNIFSENNIKLFLRLFGLIASIVIQACDFESYIYSGEVAYLTNRNLAPSSVIDLSTNVVYSLMALLHFALFCRIEALNYHYDEGIVFLVFRDETFTDFISTKFFNQLFAMMAGMIIVMIMITNYFVEHLLVIVNFNFPLSVVGYIHSNLFFQFLIVDLILMLMVYKNPILVRRILNDIQLQFRIMF